MVDMVNLADMVPLVDIPSGLGTYICIIIINLN